MDNASKAIIIAGTILIALLVISSMVILFNDGIRALLFGEQEYEKRAVIMFNDKFLKFEGEQSYQRVNEFFRVVDRSNKETQKDFTIFGIDSQEKLNIMKKYYIGNFERDKEGYVISCFISESGG